MQQIAGFDAALMAEVERETSELLGELIRLDTSNPPGDEGKVAAFLAAWFAAAGLEGEIFEHVPGRSSFVLRLPGRRPAASPPGKSLLLLAHEDVVPANAADWLEPPFAGLVKDGYVWGRGAVDIKNLLAANAVAVRRLAQAGAPFAGTLVYAATADEEEGAVGGARRLVEERPDLMRCDYVLNEGGGAFIRRGDRRIYLLETGEKGVAQFRIIVRGEAGHASVPLRRGNAVLGAARIVQALAARELPIVIDGSSAELVELLVEDAGLRARLRDAATARAALAELARRDDGIADLIEPLYGFAFSPTIVHSNSEAVNVYPSQVELSVDCRILAGRDEAEVEAEVRAALRGVDADWSMEWIGVTLGNASVYPTPYSEALGRVLRRHVPEAELAGSHCVGFTDSNWFRAAYPETLAYNFAPHLDEDYRAVTPRYHNVDERILVRDLAFQALFAEELALELLQ
jgi:acetylornithine deacetylase/succinyl-diaminopimelate desuccinylase-like protein